MMTTPMLPSGHLNTLCPCPCPRLSLSLSLSLCVCGDQCIMPLTSIHIQLLALWSHIS